MKVKNRLFIFLVLGIFILALALILFFWIYRPKENASLEERIAACGLSTAKGDVLSIRQGTVGSIYGISLGLKSVQDGKANLGIWEAKTNVSQSALNLGVCASASFADYTVYVLRITDRPSNLFRRQPGSNGDSVDIFVKKP